MLGVGYLVADMVLARRTLIAGGAGSFSVPSGTGLARWNQAIGDVSTETVDVVVIGDSITEGNNATTNANRWVELLGTNLIAEHGTQAMVYRPAGDGGGLASQPWSFSGGSMVTDYGLGRRARSMQNGDTASITFAGTGFTLVHAGGPGFGSFDYIVDGGSPVTVNAGVGSLEGGRFVTVSGLSSGSHDLDIEASGSTIIEGVIPRVGTGGFRIWEAGHGGYGVAEYVDLAALRWSDAIETLDPDLVILMLGGPDYIYSRSSTSFRANMETIIDHIRSLGDPSILVLAEWRLGGSNTYAEPWSNYVDELADLVSDDGNLAYLDLVPTFTPGYAPADPGDGLIDDGTHPTDTGMDVLADLVLAEL
jgi:lysophospholipase L1-like esterase